jgi:hypothetical protein
LTCFQPELDTQVFGKIVLVVPVVLFLSVAVAQSKVTVSGQVTLYQKVSVVPPLAVNVWAMLELPLVGDVAPARAAKLPECCPEEAIEVAAPLVVQPENVPVSKPPLTGPDGTFTVTEKDSGKSYCVQVGTGVFVFLHGTPAAMWSFIRSDSAVLAVRPSGMLFMRGVTGARFVVAARGRAEITSIRFPCHRAAAGGTATACPGRDIFRVVVLAGGLPSA